MFKQLLHMASPAGPDGRLSVFIFHRVLTEQDPIFPTEMYASHFERVCGWIAEWFNVLPLDSAVERIKGGTLPARAACITFDDGYADNHDVALPILQRHGLKSTFFIATDFLDGGHMWNDAVIESVRHAAEPVLRLDDVLSNARYTNVPIGSLAEKRSAIDALIGELKYRLPAERAALADRIAACANVRLPADLMMTSSQVRALRQAGMQIGAHTASHPILATLDRSAARAEIEQSKRVLENLLDERVSLFAYPNGKPEVDYNAESVAIARELGFDAAVSTHWGASRAGVDVFQIPRFTPWDATRLRFGVRLLRNLQKVAEPGVRLQAA